MRGCRDLSAVALALLTLTAASGAPGRPVQLGVLRLRGGVAPPIVQVDSEAAVARSAEEQAARRQRKLRLSSHHRLRRGRIGVFGCLYLFALLNGLARRSLSSAAPSLVELGHLDKARLDQLSSMGWEAFALGKLLVAPVLLALGPRMAAMLQIGIIVLASSAFCIWPGSASVQYYAWAALRLFSAMATSTTLPFVGTWFGRSYYGRVWGGIMSAFQTGYLVASYGYQPLLFSSPDASGLPFYLPFAACAAGGLLLLPLCIFFLLDRPTVAPATTADPTALFASRTQPQSARGREGGPPFPPATEIAAARDTPPRPNTGGGPSSGRPITGRRLRAALSSVAVTVYTTANPLLWPRPSFAAGAAMLAQNSSYSSSYASRQPVRLRLRPLFRRFTRRWVFWAMCLAYLAFTPIIEYAHHVTKYLNEMTAAPPGISPGAVSGDGGLLGQLGLAPPLLQATAAPRRGIVCLASTECEGRYRTYVFAYAAALLVGSWVYDAATQLDKALMVSTLYALNIACWVALALGEPNAPRVVQPQPERTASSTPSLFKGGASAADGGATGMRRRFRRRPVAAPSPRPSPEGGPPVPRLRLSTATKTALAAAAGATIAIPTSLPTAFFALDFGKEGAAVLSSFLSALGFTASIFFFRTFPTLLAKRGWFGVHAMLAILGAVAATSMSAILFADYAKFSRGYIISSSLQNETVVTLHACPRPSCGAYPMWRPGANRPWAEGSGLHPFWSLRAGTRECHRCGQTALVECKVAEPFVELALTTPYEQCLPHWTKQRCNLSKPDSGWEFADPMRYPIAPSPVQPYADRRAFAKRLERQQAEQQAGLQGGQQGAQSGGQGAGQQTGQQGGQGAGQQAGQGAARGSDGAQAGAAAAPAGAASASGGAIAAGGAGAASAAGGAGAAGASGGADTARAEVQLTSFISANDKEQA